MVTLVLIILFLTSFFAFGNFNNKELYAVVNDIEKTKSILNIEVKGKELKKKKLVPQTKQILENHSMKPEKFKKKLGYIVKTDRVNELFEKK